MLKLNSNAAIAERLRIGLSLKKAALSATNVMRHPNNKAERRRIAYKKKVRLDYDREDHVAKRLAEEELEAKEALKELGVYRTIDQPEDIS